jgi:DNA invertase Pin-like site-specific DNA recombinase
MARSVQDLLTIEGRLAAKRVTLRVLSMGGSELDTRSPTGKLMLTLLAAVAEFERALMLERQREGIAKAKGEGKYKGRAATARAQAGKVIALNGEGIGPVEIAKRLHLSRSSVQRILRQASEQTTAPS